MILLSVASLLVLLGFFVHGDSQATSEVQVAEASTTTSTVASTAASTTVAETPTTAAIFHPINDPKRIVIPSIGVDASVVPVGLLANGSMETPRQGRVGWYSPGPVPGEQGPSVLIGHVDNTKGADVFYKLKWVEPGAEVFVYGEEGDPAVFVIDSLEQQPKSELPKDRIWEYSGSALIRLITCGGEFDRTSRHYLSNVIVYGHLVR